jgi:hypothetical protein
MLRVATFALVIALFSACAMVPSAITVQRVGTYEIEDKTLVPNPNSPSLVSLKTEMERGQTKVIPREETSVIYGKVGYSFGVEYQVPEPLQEGLRVVFRPPPPGVKDLRTGKFLSVSDFKPPCLGTRCTAIYNFEHESELVAGEWKLEAWARNKLLFVHRFELKQ